MDENDNETSAAVAGGVPRASVPLDSNAPITLLDPFRAVNVALLTS